MIHVVILVTGLFFNPVTGDTAEAKALVETPMECATVINDNRAPRETDSGMYYLIDAQCIGVYLNDKGELQ